MAMNRATNSMFLITAMTSDRTLCAGDLNSRFIVSISRPLAILRPAYR
jgi:hypothetical protein